MAIITGGLFTQTSPAGFVWLFWGQAKCHLLQGDRMFPGNADDCPTRIDGLLVDQIKLCFVLAQQARPVRFEKLPEQLPLSVFGFVISVY